MEEVFINHSKVYLVVKHAKQDCRVQSDVEFPENTRTLSHDACCSQRFCETQNMTSIESHTQKVRKKTSSFSSPSYKSSSSISQPFYCPPFLNRGRYCLREPFIYYPGQFR